MPLLALPFVLSSYLGECTETMAPFSVVVVAESDVDATIIEFNGVVDEDDTWTLELECWPFVRGEKKGDSIDSAKFCV